MVLLNLDRTSEAVGALRKGMRIARNRGNTLLLSVVAHNLGETHRRLGQLRKAERYLQEALHASELLGSADDVLNTLLSMGLLELDSGNLKNARRVFVRMMSLAKKTKNRLARGLAINGLADVAYNRKRFERSIAGYSSATRCFVSLKEFRKAGLATTNAGSAASKLGQHLKAIQLFYKAAGFSAEAHDQEGTAIAVMFLAKELAIVGRAKDAANGFLWSVASYPDNSEAIGDCLQEIVVTLNSCGLDEVALFRQTIDEGLQQKHLKSFRIDLLDAIDMLARAAAGQDAG
jgi:tetratricopeptide (TPR) repeat protein